MTLESQMFGALSQIWTASSDSTWILGRLGVKTSATTYTIDVPGMAGYVYVSIGVNGEQGQATARNGVGAASVGWQKVRMRRENNTLVIRDADSYAAGGGGGGATNLDALTDVTLTTPANGNTLQYNSSSGQWVNVVPPGGTGGAPSPHDLSGVHHSGLLDWDLLNFSGSSLGDLATRSHGQLTGIGPDQHHFRQHNIITGDAAGVVHTVAGSAFQLVGLTATDTLGLLTPSSNPGFTGAILRTSSTGGLNVASGMLIVDPATHLVSIDSPLFVVDTVAETVNVDGNLHFGGGNRVIDATNSLKLAPTTDLQIEPGGVVAYADRQESRTNTFTDSVTGILGFRLFDNSGGGNAMQLTTNTLKADNIFARKFQADEQRVARGSWFLTYSYGIVETSFAVPAVGATVDAWFEEAPGLGAFKLFSANHWIMFRIIDPPSGIIAVTIWFQAVDADGSGTNDYIQRQDQTATTLARQQWRLIRRQGGATGMVVQKGETAADFALPPHLEGSVPIPGQGIVYASSLYEDSGPFVQVQTFESVVANVPQFKNRVRMGNLDGTVDYSGPAWGFAAGADLGVLPSAGFSGVAIDAVGGTRLFNTDLTLYASDGIAVVELTRAHGLAFRYDDIAFADPLRFIGWYDNLSDLSGQPTVGIAGTSSIDSGQLWRRLYVHNLASDGSEIAIDLFASGQSGTAGALFLSRGRHSDNTQAPLIAFNASETHFAPTVVIGPLSADAANARAVNASPLTLLGNSTQTDHRSGATIMQLNNLGDAVLHWNLRAYGAGGDTFVSQQWYSAGIDGNDGNKFKISAGENLGDNDFLIYDPSDSSVTILGFDTGGSTPPPAVSAGFGIDVSGSGVISVDSDVARSGTAILTDPGSGLQGGGDLAATRHLAVLVPGGGGLQLIAGGIVIDSTIAGAGLHISPTKVLSVDSSLFASSGLHIFTDAGLSGGGTLGGDLHLAVELAPTTPGLDFDGSGRLRVDTSVVRNTLVLTAGPGLTGGGDLSVPRTFNVGQGSGIIVNADDVAVDFSLVARNVVLTAGAGLMGGGDLSANRTFNVVAGNATLIVSADSMVVNQNFDFAWTGNQTWSQPAIFNGAVTIGGTATFNSAPQVNADLNFIGGIRSITAPAATQLNILPGGDLVLWPGYPSLFNKVLPGSSGKVDLGGYNRKWSTLYASELYVETLVASSVMATIGGRVMIAPTSSLIADFAIGATSIDLKHNSFASGTWLYLENIVGVTPQSEAIKLTSGPTTITGGYRYTCTRGTGAPYMTGGPQNWLTGDAVVSLGRIANDGYIDQASVQTIHTKVGPTVTIYSRTAATNWNDVAPVVSLGNLNGFAGISGSLFGFAAGNNLTLSPTSGFSGVTADTTYGVRLFNTPLEIYESGNKVVKLDKLIGLSFEYNNFTSSSANISWYDNLGDLPGAAPTGSILAQISVGKLISSAYSQGMYIVAGSIDLTAGQMEVTLANDGLHVFGTTGFELLTVLANGNVGIGNTSPNVALYVKKDQAAAVTQAVVENSTASGYAAFTARADASAQVFFGKRGSTSAGYRFLAAGDAYLLNQVAGDISILNDVATGAINLGAGASPTPHLTIAAGGTVGMNGTIRTTSFAAPASGVGLEMSWLGSGPWGQISAYDRTANAYRVMHIDSSILALNADSGGNVSIGGTVPTAKLDVVGTMRSLSFAAPTSGVGLEMSYFGAGPWGQISAIDRATTTFKVLHVDSSLLALNSAVAGNVVIGQATITDPFSGASANAGQILQIASTTAAAGTTQYTILDLMANRTGGSATTAMLTFSNKALAGAEKRLVSIGALTGTTNDDGTLVFATLLNGVLTESMRITENNFVGIGTTPAAGAILDMVGSFAGVLKARLQNTSATSGSYTSYQLLNSAGSVGAFFMLSPTNPAYAGPSSFNMINAANAPLGLGTNDTVRMTIDGAGNVGVGATSPSSLFEVLGATGGVTLTRTSNVVADEPFFLLRKGTVPSSIAQIRGIHGGGLRFTDGSSSTEWMRINANGLVGINTAGPSAQLDVLGVIRSISSVGTPTTGTGLQLYWNGSYGSVSAYNTSLSGAAAFQPMQIEGNTLLLNAASNAQVGVATTNIVGQLGVEANSTLASPRPGLSSTIYSNNFGAFNGAPHLLTRSAQGSKAGFTNTVSGDDILAIEGYGFNAGGVWNTVPSVAIYGRASQTYNNGQTNGGARLEIFLRDNSVAGSPAAAAFWIDQAGNATVNGNLQVNDKNATGGRLRVNNMYIAGQSASLAYSTDSSPNDNIICHSGSSLRFKKEIRPLPPEYGPDFVMKLNPAIFKFKGPEDDAPPNFRPDSKQSDHIGLIAEAVAEAGGTPFVVFDPDGQAEGLHYEKLTVPLIATVQQQQKRMVELEFRIEELERKLAS